MREEVFKEIQQQFLNVPFTVIDEKIRDIVFFFKNSSVNEVVVPRWSCQSHDSENFKTYDIIFFHKNEKGKQLIENMFRDIHSEYIEQYGISYTASVNLTTMYLLCPPDWDVPYEHLQISFSCDGHEIAINRSHDIWLKVLEEKYK